MENKNASLYELLKSLYINRRLISHMSNRDILVRYKGSVLGLLWSFITPLIMLIIYTIVFSTIFKAKFASEQGVSTLSYATNLFVGLVLHGLIAEVFGGAPQTILANANYVKKVIFPLEILSVISLRVAVFNALVGLCALLLMFFILNSYINWTILFIPVIALPFLMLILGFAWIISSLGVYIRDISQIIGILVTILLFLSPIFYSISSVPPSVRGIIVLNPLTLIVEQMRAVIIIGSLPSFLGLVVYYLIALLVCWLGFIFFQRTRGGFADVI